MNILRLKKYLTNGKVSKKMKTFPLSSALHYTNATKSMKTQETVSTNGQKILILSKGRLICAKIWGLFYIPTLTQTARNL